jgi:hypothetical protein
MELLFDNSLYISTGDHSVTTANDTSETTIFTATPVYGGRIVVELDLATLVAAGEGGIITTRMYHMIDEENLRIVDEDEFVIGEDTVMPRVEGSFSNTTASNCRVTIQCSDDVSETRVVPWMRLEAIGL